MKDNPFVLPGFGQSGPAGQNPILASMEMMRQAWEGLASSGGVDTAAMGQVLSVEEMDKRISDLRAVENWLRMNLSMLSSTIQALEVQRATVATLKSFIDTGMASTTRPSHGSQAGASAAGGESPLDEMLRRWPEQAESTQPAEGAKEASASAQTDQSDIVGAAATAAQGWWNMLQQQFQTLAAATAASAQEAQESLQTQADRVAPKAPAKTAARTASGKTAARKTAAKAGAKTATKRARKAPSKTSAKATARKTSR